MRNISFALTQYQIEHQKKDVTRRLGCEFLKVGEILRPVEKSMGLKAGEKVKMLGSAYIEIISIEREPLERLLQGDQYCLDEIRREGFQHQFTSPELFVEFFIKHNKGLTIATPLTRIEFGYLPRGYVPSEDDHKTPKVIMPRRRL